MNKKGFTLVELLGIIVILAIIAVLLVPKVINIIKDAKLGSAEQSATFYVNQVELVSAQNKMTGDDYLDGVYLINSTGDLCSESQGVDCESPIMINVEGTKPTGGMVVLEQGKVKARLTINPTKRTMINVGDYNISYNINQEMRGDIVCYFADEITQKYTTIGLKYNCHLGNEDATFYLLETEEETFSLILDHNLGEIKSLTAKEAISELTTLTKDWTDIINVELPTAQQLTNAASVRDNKNYSIAARPTLPDWLRTNISTTKDTTKSWGYWTKTPKDAGTTYYLYLDGRLGGDTNPRFCTNIGVRPVITVYKNKVGM